MRSTRRTLAALLLAHLCGACHAFASSSHLQPVARVLAPPSARAAAAESKRPRLASISMQTEPKAAETNAEAEDGSGGIRQLLGLKGASEADRDAPFNWKIRLQLMKPATWVPLIWGVACGAAASGNYRWPFLSGTLSEGAEDFAKAATCMVLSGPFLTGFCQTINDWRRLGVRFRT